MMHTETYDKQGLQSYRATLDPQHRPHQVRVEHRVNTEIDRFFDLVEEWIAAKEAATRGVA